jgi:molybdopterin molybdotransferase
MISLSSARAWIDAHVAPLGGEMVPLAAASLRVLAQDVLTPADLPDRDRAAIDGLAVRASETAGASAYNPLSFNGQMLNAGEELPAGADAIVPLAFVERGATGQSEIIEPVPGGYFVCRRASAGTAGEVMLRRGRVLTPPDIGLLALVEIATVQIVRQPRVSCLLAGPASGPDANGAMLSALITRDGGITAPRLIGRDRAAMAGALAQADADAIIVAGGTGQGANDAAAAALAEAGTLVHHGIAICPGETAGIGWSAAGIPVFLLPGMPADCLWAYELLAGCAIRRLGGRDSALPFPARKMKTARKFVSAIGIAEVVPLACLDGGLAQPLAAFAEVGLAATVAADGFVIIPEDSEGVVEGTEVAAYLYSEPQGPTP